MMNMVFKVKDLYSKESKCGHKCTNILAEWIKVIYEFGSAPKVTEPRQKRRAQTQMSKYRRNGSIEPSSTASITLKSKKEYEMFLGEPFVR